MGIGEKLHSVREGDSLFIPAGTIHWYENDGKSNAEFLCIVPKAERYCKVYLEEDAPAAPKRGDSKSSSRKKK